MPKRKFAEMRAKNRPFGVALNLDSVKCKYGLGSKSHHVENYIQYFEQGQPIFQKPDDVLVVEKTDGMFATIQGKSKRVHISTLHTNHTISLYGLAHSIKTVLTRMPPVRLQAAKSSVFKNVDMRLSQTQVGHTEVHLNAQHLGKTVVLKTTTRPLTQLKYILEAVIHYYLVSRCPQYFPELYFIGFDATTTGKLIMCSEQLGTGSVTSFMRQTTTDDKAVLQMVQDVCQALLEIQKVIKFTHRDCHISNIYYDQPTQTVKLIDFDWSSVEQEGRKISVPRHLYDTTRPQYCDNQSVDCCIFLRTLGPTLATRAPWFMDNIYTPLMLRYEKESKKLLQKWSTTETAAMQLYKMSTSDQTMRGHYSHSHGLKHRPQIFDYLMAYYEWPSLTPQAILDFIHKSNTDFNT